VPGYIDEGGRRPTFELLFREGGQDEDGKGAYIHVCGCARRGVQEVLEFEISTVLCRLVGSMHLSHDTHYCYCHTKHV
jgi:hypothetical protein